MTSGLYLKWDRLESRTANSSRWPKNNSNCSLP